METRTIPSRRVLLFIVILALASQACATSLIQWPFPNFPGTSVDASIRRANSHTSAACRSDIYHTIT